MQKEFILREVHILGRNSMLPQIRGINNAEAILIKNSLIKGLIEAFRFLFFWIRGFTLHSDILLLRNELVTILEFDFQELDYSKSRGCYSNLKENLKCQEQTLDYNEFLNMLQIFEYFN